MPAGSFLGTLFFVSAAAAAFAVEAVGAAVGVVFSEHRFQTALNSAPVMSAGSVDLKSTVPIFTPSENGFATDDYLFLCFTEG